MAIFIELTTAVSNTFNNITTKQHCVYFGLNNLSAAEIWDIQKIVEIWYRPCGWLRFAMPNFQMYTWNWINENGNGSQIEVEWFWDCRRHSAFKIMTHMCLWISWNIQRVSNMNSYRFAHDYFLTMAQFPLSYSSILAALLTCMIIILLLLLNENAGSDSM